ncbi:hypothetical protein PCYB_103660 [Plasmodium cynomolgi strain B]|uniref:MMS19 nucleotide excision repair protein n=1 Tax=Plasmodium cynomolgi (strain B) TaxID=1120755 RepID=K6UDQ6_PLACD|nr:hypothetical protein PCYB_103660 [Plasmodium cynomolgi strain B]GAB67016.1 hypothetical protein PCYB_103660 [Plasmodium cynomolgi strain B]
MVAIPNFIDKIQVQLENESDPRNILVLFDIIHVLCSGYITHDQGGVVQSGGTAERVEQQEERQEEQLGQQEEGAQGRNPGALFTRDRETHYLKSVIDIAFYYFPIEFVNSEGRYDSITEEDLQKAFYMCLKSNKRLGNYVIMNILDELYNTQDEEINEKNLQNIKETLGVCAPFYGSVCCSGFISTITGLIELECIDSDASDKMATYFVKILFLFFKIVNEEKNEELRRSLFDMHFAGMFRKFNNFLILHKCLCSEKQPLGGVAPEAEAVERGVEPPVGVSSTGRPSLAQLFRLEEIANLSDSSQSGSVRSVRSGGSDRSNRSGGSNRSNRSGGSNRSSRSGGSAPKERSECTSESDRNILAIIREKNHIEKMKERKERQNKRNKIKLNKFPVIEKILVCLSKGSTYVFLYVLETTLKPMLHECYYLVHALTGEGESPPRGSAQETRAEQRGQAGQRGQLEQRGQAGQRGQLEQRGQAEQGSLPARNAKVQAKWNLVATYLSFINNVMSESAKVEEVVARGISFVKEICIIGELLRMGRDQFFHAYHDSGLHLFGILASFVCMHGGAAVGGSVPNSGTEHGSAGSPTNDAAGSATNDVADTATNDAAGSATNDAADTATNDAADTATNEDALFHQAIILFFYLIGMHPGENVKLRVLGHSGRDLLDHGEDHLLKSAGEWRRSIVEEHHQFISDIKLNNENIVRECKEYKKNDLLFFLTLVSKIIKHKYEQIGNYLNTLLMNMCFLLLKFHFGKNEDLNLHRSLLRETYQVDIPYLFFISTNVASFVVKKFYHCVEEVKEKLLILKKEEDTTGSVHTRIEVDNQTDCQLDLELSPQMGEYDPHSGMTPGGVITELLRFGGGPIGETLKWKRVQVKCLLVDPTQGDTLKKSYETEVKEIKKRWGEAKQEEGDTTWERQSFKLTMCEPTNREDITSFYLAYIVSLAYSQIYKRCERVMQRYGSFSVSDGSPHDRRNNQDKVENELCKPQNELCKPHLLVNNMEVMELCINYLYEEAVVRSILSRGTSTEEGEQQEEQQQEQRQEEEEKQQKGHNKADNLKCILIVNSSDELSYYGTYVNNLKSFIRINEVKNLHLRDQITKRGEAAKVGHSHISPMTYLSCNNPFRNVDVFETDTLLYILKITLTSHVICEDWRGKAKQEGDVEMSILASYLYRKVKKNVNHIFITMSEAKKKAFIERMIDFCVGGDVHPHMSDKDGIFGGSIEESYHLDNLIGAKFTPRLMNPLLLLFLPALLSIHTQIGLDHMQKLLKLCMYIFLFNLPLESCSSNRVSTCENNSNGGGTCWEGLTRGAKNGSAHLSRESVSKFLDEKGKEHFKEGEVPFWDGDHVGDCLLHLDRANLESVHKCALQIVGILLHNWDGIHKMVNYILAPFDLVDDLGISLNGALSFKRFIDLFASTYEAFIRRWEKGGVADSKGEQLPRGDESPLVQLLSKLFEAPTWDTSNQLFYLLDCVYFGEEDPYFAQIFYSRGKNEHPLREKGTAKGMEIGLLDRTYLKGMEIGLLDRTYLKGENREGPNLGELKFVSFYPHEEGTIRVANLKEVICLAGGQSIGGGEENGKNSSGSDRDEGNLFLRRYFLHFFVQHFSLNYDLTFHLWKHTSEEVAEENLQHVCDSVASTSLHQHTFKQVLIWYFYLYPSQVYSHIYSVIHNINTKLLLSDENYNRVAFNPNDAFLSLCREKLLHFICTMYNYLYLIDVSERFLSMSEFLWLMEREKFSFDYSLPFDVIRRNEKTLTFLEKLSSYLGFYNESSDRGISKSATLATDKMDQMKRESNSDEHLSDSLTPGLISSMDASHQQVKEHSVSNPRKAIEADGDHPKGSNFLSLLQKRKENRILKYNCRYLCLVHLASIVLLNTPMEDALRKHYNVMEMCILKGIAPPKEALQENVQFLLSYKCRLVKSLLKLIVSVPLPLARYQCACIFYVISFLNYKSFLPYDVIQDIKWYLSIASVDPHKKVRKMVVLCRARWM